MAQRFFQRTVPANDRIHKWWRRDCCAAFQAAIDPSLEAPTPNLETGFSKAGDIARHACGDSELSSFRTRFGPSGKQS
jgi:hypothetical protein